MFKTFLRSFLLIVAGQTWGGLVHAEGGCSPGSYPIGGRSVAACAPIPGYGNQQAPQLAAAQWERRWGAIATGETKAVLGTVTDMRSKSEAVKAALADCAGKGGSPCELQISYDNQCVVMVVGDKGFNFSNAVAMDHARQNAMKVCGADGDTSCHVYYSACSPPVRTR